MKNTVYYLPGRGGRVATGLGEGIIELGYEPSGLETPWSFEGLTFQEQLDMIIQDLRASFWTKNAKIVAVSYGAYLLLNALSEHEPFPGSILLLSPVLGEVTNGKTMRYYSPPRPSKIIEQANAGEFPHPKHIEIHVGDNDWQSPYERVVNFANALGGNYAIVPDTKHDLGKSYVFPILKKWLTGTADAITGKNGNP